ncbi:MAG TPA: Rieske 2Fe-2S domain-containing protein [Chitinophagaceae bacterium]|jgi:3-phenylpropionate/trans-cinnamate dioxygenase ferredoxin subunit|nr:Rieske 2Fe-2S domain-containing protein [Chitinophagaceae bacterium]
MSNLLKYTWHKIAQHPGELLFNASGLTIAEAGGKKITIAKVNNIFFACAHKCPHASGILADGFIDAAGNIVCPLHRYKFNLSNGRNVTGEGYYLKTYPVEVREDGIYVGFEEKKLFGLW